MTEINPREAATPCPARVIASRAIRRAGVQIPVDDDVQGVAREPVSPAAPGCVRLSGAGHPLTGLDERLSPYCPRIWARGNGRSDIIDGTFEVVTIACHLRRVDARKSDQSFAEH